MSQDSLLRFCSIERHRRGIRKKGASCTVYCSQRTDGNSSGLGWRWRLHLRYVSRDSRIVPVFPQLLPIFQGATDSFKVSGAERLGHVGAGQSRHVLVLYWRWQGSAWRVLHESNLIVTNRVRWNWTQQSGTTKSQQQLPELWQLASTDSDSSTRPRSTNASTIVIRQFPKHHKESVIWLHDNDEETNNNVGDKAPDQCRLAWKPCKPTRLCSTADHIETSNFRYSNRVSDHQRGDIRWRQLRCQKRLHRSRAHRWGTERWSERVAMGGGYVQRRSPVLRRISDRR